MFATNGPIRMTRGAPRISKIGWRDALKTPPKRARGGREKGGRPVRVETKVSAIISATDVLLSQFSDRHRAKPSAPEA